MEEDKTRVLARQSVKPENRSTSLEDKARLVEPGESHESSMEANDADSPAENDRNLEEDDQTRVVLQQPVASVVPQKEDQELTSSVAPWESAAHSSPVFGGIDRQRPGERPLRPGDTLKGRFFIEEVIAEGGMGVVFKARDRIEATGGINDSFIAIKMLGKNFKPQPEAWKALLSEAKKTKNLAHPNIIKVYDFDHDPDWDEYFMTMEYLQGQSLEQLLRNSKGRPVEPALAYQIINGIARALEYAHAQKLVHSDMKPSNVFLTRDNEVKVLDFGIARVIRKGEAESDNTVFGIERLHAYTVAYASLEIIKGYSPDPRDDVYALACIAYKLLSGRHPFGVEGENQGAVFACDTGLVPEPIKGLTQRQWRALTRGLAFVRNERTATVTEFLNGMMPRSSRFKVTATGVALILGSLVGVAVYYAYQQTVIERPKLIAPATPALRSDTAASIEQEGLALLTRFEEEPASPSKWLGLAAQAHSRLSVQPLRQVENVQQRLNKLVARFMEQSRQALANNDRTSANDYLTLAETLNVDPAYEQPLREARDEWRKNNSLPPKSAEQQLVELMPQMNSLPISLSRSVYRDNELIRLDFDLPVAGNLHLFHFRPGEKATLLFPNPLTQDNRVGRGPMHFPNTKQIKLMARTPYGRSWFIVTAEPNPVNLFRQYAKGRPQKKFAELSPEDLVALLKDRLNDNQVKIGHIEMMVCPASGNCE